MFLFGKLFLNMNGVVARKMVASRASATATSLRAVGEAIQIASVVPPSQ